MNYNKKSVWPELIRKRCLLSAVVLPALLVPAFGVAQTTPAEEKLEVASVDATVVPATDEEAAGSETSAPKLDVAPTVMDATAKARADAVAQFLKTSDDKLDAADRAGIAALYEDRGYKSIWMVDGAFKATSKDLIFEIGRADKIGLNPADYALPDADLGAGLVLPDAKLFEAELQMSLAAVRYVRHLSSGRLVPLSVSASLDITPQRPDPKAVLADLSIADDPLSKAQDYHPKHPAYRALLKELAALDGKKEEKPIIIEPGKMLRPGMQDARIPQLRARLKVELPAPAAAPETDAETEVASGETPAQAPEVDETLYDDVLVAAVKEFQKENRLTQDGIVGPSTLRTLNGDSNIDRKSKLIVNLERWRWAPKDLGQFHVIANIPEYRVYVMKDGDVTHSTRVVVGKSKHKTVAFSDEMEHFVVNPSWGVPQSIIKNEMLPSARSNPGYFSRKGYQVFAKIRGRTRQVDPNRVNWRRVSASQISVRQPPGASNALGQIKFLFPNKHAIYMHDTPSKSLFNRDVRAFSHGCVRIHNPMEFADALLLQQQDWNAARIKKLVGGREATINLDKHIPVHLVYFTSILKEDGSIGYLSDVYGHDSKMAKILNL